MRRDCILFVRLSAFEKDLAARAAAEARLSVSEYIRTVLRETTRGPLARPGATVTGLDPNVPSTPTE